MVFRVLIEVSLGSIMGAAMIVIIGYIAFVAAPHFRFLPQIASYLDYVRERLSKEMDKC